MGGGHLSPDYEWQGKYSVGKRIPLESARTNQSSLADMCFSPFQQGWIECNLTDSIESIWLEPNRSHQSLNVRWTEIHPAPISSHWRISNQRITNETVRLYNQATNTVQMFDHDKSTPLFECNSCRTTRSFDRTKIARHSQMDQIAQIAIKSHQIAIKSLPNRYQIAERFDQIAQIATANRYQIAQIAIANRYQIAPLNR